MRKGRWSELKRYSRSQTFQIHKQNRFSSTGFTCSLIPFIYWYLSIPRNFVNRETCTFNMFFTIFHGETIDFHILRIQPAGNEIVLSRVWAPHTGSKANQTSSIILHIIMCGFSVSILICSYWYIHFHDWKIDKSGGDFGSRAAGLGSMCPIFALIMLLIVLDPFKDKNTLILNLTSYVMTY